MNLTLTLPVNAVASIIDALGARPYNDVAALINEVRRQATEQIEASNAAVKVDEPEAEPLPAAAE